MALDMRSGNPTTQMLKFAFPMLIGNVFQQLYNMVDSVVVGRFVGKNALAAVGSSFSLMNFITLLIIGLCMGSSIVISQYFGADDSQRLKRTISTSFIFIIGLTIFLSITTFIFAKPLLILIKTPVEILDGAASYLRIIFAGLIFISLYNIAAALLRAVGDSKTPLYFLIVAAVINVILDLVFIINFNMGIEGAAYATVIAQAVASILSLIYIFSKVPILKMKRKEFIFDKSLFSVIAKYSVLSSMQQSIMAIGMVAVQGRVNMFGADVIAAYTAAVRVDSLAYLPVQDFGNAFSTYVAQNVGAGKIDRVKKGFISSVKIVLAFCIITSIIILTFSEQFMKMFVDPSEIKVIQTGVDYISVVGIFYLLIGFLFLFYGLFRGVGSLSMCIVLTVISLGTRVVMAFSLSSIPFIAEKGIWWSIPIGWILADIVGFVVYKKGKWQNHITMYSK
ncbi:MATE efflux family protein MatE [Gottschalkia acidurici 9a]|uniref:Probable multidrug resistance protein NorM n=1 Tax=Gottschalkia acidurici (strain ATCC 7906 / DSM 604 / BCRC 14475 / CIP 104303 / KCTC 5404 / NCIMB 10678 / 9a) TaxID=1128398 RepID=K0B2K1_GOTA9|nr:MATE family efflux transporter [Gottschalkia acidurici]AFS79724.1 MATE efflux family protein MatE [Gottschalkia acidurici 9a]